jgi:PhnB protein
MQLGEWMEGNARPNSDRSTGQHPVSAVADTHSRRNSQSRDLAPRQKETPMPVKPIPDGYRSVTAYLAVRQAADAIEFYRRAFGAKERMRLTAPDGKVRHAELEIGDSVIMLTDEFPDMEFRGPASLGGTSVTLHLYVKDVDAGFRRATEAGAKPVREVQDQFYGDRSGAVRDPFGHVWHIATHKEDLTPDELARRAEAMFKRQAKA